MKEIVLAFLFCVVFPCMLHAQQPLDTISLFFAVDKSAVEANNALLLDELIADTSITGINIYGYADFLGSAAYNQQLSERRSVNVQDYLIGKGVSREKISVVKGYGVHPNSAEENRKDFSDSGIQAHRMVQVAYGRKPQNSSGEEKLSDEVLVENTNIVLENIHFHGACDLFLPKSYSVLKELLEIMQKHPTLKIEIQGYICCHYDTGNDQDYEGNPLSFCRAEAVYDYLVVNGVDPARLSYVGFGSSRKRFPLEQNEYERAMNRRVEILILEK
jgi:outer membrane protein OmpA-like peptidoglycan-associated protein